MTVAAGDIIKASDINKVLDRRVGSNFVVVNSAGFTTITVINTLVVNLVAGRTYGLNFSARISSSIAADACLVRIKPGSVAGTDLNVTQSGIPTASNSGWDTELYAEFTASATGSQTFVSTVERSIGSGTIIVRASATGAAILTCDYISG